MKKPTWVTIIGIFGICMGVFGLLAGAQSILTPQMAAFQKQIFSHFQKALESESRFDSPSSETAPSRPHREDIDSKEMMALVDDMMTVPPWFGNWMIIQGILKIVLGGVYIFASISLIQTKPFSVPLFYFSAGSTLFCNIIAAVLGLVGGSMLSISMIPGAIVGSVIHGILILVVLFSPKEVFLRQ